MPPHILALPRRRGESRRGNRRRLRWRHLKIYRQGSSSRWRLRRRESCSDRVVPDRRRFPIAAACRGRSWGGRGRDSLIRAAIVRASSTFLAMPFSGCFNPSFLRRSRNCSRSPAASRESTVVPMMGTPASDNPRARFNGVWPPNWTMTPFTKPFSTCFRQSATRCASASSARSNASFCRDRKRRQHNQRRWHPEFRTMTRE